LCFRPNESRIKSEIDEVFSYIKNNFTEDISLDDISAVAHMNKNYLVRKFKNNYGISPISYLIKLRMDYAKKLLAESDIPIKVIAASCGYSDPSFFNSYFKKTFHITPAAYRQLHQESNKHIEY